MKSISEKTILCCSISIFYFKSSIEFLIVNKYFVNRKYLLNLFWDYVRYSIILARGCVSSFFF